MDVNSELHILKYNVEAESACTPNLPVDAQSASIRTPTGVVSMDVAVRGTIDMKEDFLQYDSVRAANLACGIAL